MTAPGWYSETDAYDPGSYKGASDYVGDLEERAEVDW